MIAITLNLLAEEQLAQEARARDPLKTAIAIGAGVVALVAICGSALFYVAGQKRTQVDILSGKWKSLSAGLESGELAEFRALTAQATDIVALNKSRGMFAPQLALLKDVVPDSVQLTHVNFSVNTESSAPPPVETDDANDPKNLKAKRAAAPKNVERLSLIIEGRASGGRPEMEVDSFLQTLRTSPQFGAQLSQIQLRSIARAPNMGDQPAASAPIALFVIECVFKERK